ncbi:hypothetical protein M513_14292 [Trichuris suis]|uniref:Uncharacterized protein n=1 Tax=Trichuris suis TaxID=68888 RepID=A0A085LIN5_9BILA|nr:hypothetical protein M513_14292 [Trichuris suis]
MAYHWENPELFTLDYIVNEIEESLSGYNSPHVLDVGTSRNRSGKDNCLVTNGGVSSFTKRSESPNG